MQKTQESSDTSSTVMITTDIVKPSIQSPASDTKENQRGQSKQYYFQTQTKRLKTYYLDNKGQIIGRKILFNNSSGTVRYFGPLQHTGKPQTQPEELWIGIEWDEQNRGKHNGTVNGFKYFECPANQGSMIKYEKIEFGYRLEIALFKRYFKSEQLHHAKDIYDNLKIIKQEMKAESEQNKNNKIEEAMVKKAHKIEYDAEAYLDTVKKTKKIMIEFVGFDQIWNKINNLDKIQSISLAQCRICDLGPLGHLSGLLKSLKILSLEDNLLSDWNQIYQLGYELPELQQLSVAYNNLHSPEYSFEDLKQVTVTGRTQSFQLQGRKLFPNLKSLILIKTGLNWQTFFKVVAAFKHTNEFILCKNDLSDFQNVDKEKLKYLKEARFLNLEECNLQNFHDLQVFSELPRLQKLILNKNRLQQIGRKVSGFKQLKYLSVQECAFLKPVVLYQLSLFENLESLNVKHNLIGDRYGHSYVRMRAVAEITKLNQINGALLKKGERRDFEIFYMRESFHEYFAVKKVPDYDYDFDDFLKYCEEHHPNIMRLVKKYGNPYEVQKKKEIQVLIKEEVKATENKKGTGMVEVLIEYKDTGALDKKKVPLSWTLSSLKNFFSKTVKIPVMMLKLTCLTQEGAEEEEMTEDHKTLSFYSLKSGSKLIVARKLVG